MALFRRKNPLTREESLKCVPVRNATLKTVHTANHEALITVPRRNAWWANLLAKTFGIPEERQIQLDELGTFAWDHCDGKTSVASLVGQLRSRYKLSHREAEISMTAYLRQLAKKRLIGLAVPSSVVRGRNKSKKQQK